MSVEKQTSIIPPWTEPADLPRGSGDQWERSHHRYNCYNVGRGNKRLRLNAFQNVFAAGTVHDAVSALILSLTPYKHVSGMNNIKSVLSSHAICTTLQELDVR